MIAGAGAAAAALTLSPAAAAEPAPPAPNPPAIPGAPNVPFAPQLASIQTVAPQIIQGVASVLTGGGQSSATLPVDPITLPRAFVDMIGNAEL